MCSSSQFWYALPFFGFGFALGILTTLLVLGCCGAAIGTQYFFFLSRTKQTAETRRHKSRRVRRKRSPKSRGRRDSEEETEEETSPSEADAEKVEIGDWGDLPRGSGSRVKKKL